MYTHTLLLIYFYALKSNGDCGNEIGTGDRQLNPQVFFPNTNGELNTPQNCVPPLVGNINSNAPQQQNPSYVQQQTYQPSQMYTQPVAITQQPQQYPPNMTGKPAIVCDNSGERDAFKKCVSDAIKSLRNILENCRKALGKDAKECCLSEDCLSSLLGRTSKKSIDADDSDESSDDEPRHKKRRHSENRYGNDEGYSSTDSLEEFIRYLESRLNEKNKGRWDNKPSYSHRSKVKRDYDEYDDDMDDSRLRKKHRRKSKKHRSKKNDCKDPCED